MKSLPKEKRYDLIDAFNLTSRYLDDLLNIDNIHFVKFYKTVNHLTRKTDNIVQFVTK